MAPAGPNPVTCDALVIGAGAAGLMSGGGRCNFTNLGVAPERFVSANPHFARSARARYTPADFIALVDSHGPRRAFRVSAIPKEPSPQ